jgi:3-deoxy-manno-octulosonate cytidylyltransferase (CMP-KDO synthetase)
MARPYAILIPARYGSTRLPGKMLLRETGKYLVQHTHEQALRAAGRPRVLVLTDDARVEAAVRSYGGEVRRTRPEHASGTDRCAEAVLDLDEPVIVNLQGDEPLIDPDDLARLAAAVAVAAEGGSGAGADIATLGYPFPDEDAMRPPQVVKALRRPDGLAAEFRRSVPTPAEREGLDLLHHVGVYAFRRERLLDFARLEPSPREITERLEQLRALENGWRVRVLVASRPGFGIDTREDYERFVQRHLHGGHEHGGREL